MLIPVIVISILTAFSIWCGIKLFLMGSGLAELISRYGIIIGLDSSGHVRVFGAWAGGCREYYCLGSFLPWRLLAIARASLAANSAKSEGER